jgi:aminoglycoside 6'-N-acetyltransferase
MPDVTFRELTDDDLPLLRAWLAQPHVAEHWDDEVPGITRGLPLDVDVAHYLACEGVEPVAFVQAYRVMAGQSDGWWVDETDPRALGIDLFIGPAERVGAGLGVRVIRAFVAFLFEDPRVTAIQADPQPANERSIAALRKAGFTDVGVVHTPDGPSLLMRTR